MLVQVWEYGRKAAHQTMFEILCLLETMHLRPPLPDGTEVDTFQRNRHARRERSLAKPSRGYAGKKILNRFIRTLPDVWRMEDGVYEVTSNDLPADEIYQCGEKGRQVCLRSLEAGERNYPPLKIERSPFDLMSAGP
jgi:hypothetical protein